MAASTAWADLQIMSFSYDQFVGTYVGTDKGGQFSLATASSGASSMDFLRRVVEPFGLAMTQFDGSHGLADFDVNLSVANIMGNTAEGAGDFAMVDVDGDKITAKLEGTWTRLADDWAVFRGVFSDIQITLVNPAQAWFNGTGGTPVSLDFTRYGSPPAPMSGAMTQLELNFGRWFTKGDFTASSGGYGQFAIVPAPAAVGLVGIGLGLIAWLKRRVA